MILAAKMPVLPYRTPPVKEAEVEAGEEGEDEESPPVGEEGLQVSEERGHEGVDEGQVEPSLPQLRHRLPRQLHQLLHTLLTASPSKGQLLRIPLHHPRGPVRLHSVLEVLSWRGMVTSVIRWHGMTAHLGTRLFRVQKIARQDLRRRRLHALAVSSRRLLHKRSHGVCATLTRKWFSI